MKNEKDKKVKKQKKQRSMAYKNARAGYLFISPFIIGFIGFMVVPMYQSLKMAFSNVLFTDGISYEFIKFGNFKYAFTIDAEFGPLLINELIRMAYTVPAIIIFSFFISIVLNQNFRGRGLVRAIFFLPVILSSGVLVGLETSNTLMAGMQDVIAETSNLTSITDTLKAMVLPEGTNIGAIKYVFDAVDEVYNIAMASGIDYYISIRATDNSRQYV